MLSLIVSFIIGSLCAWAVSKDHGIFAAIISGAGALVISQVIATLILRRLIAKRQQQIENILLEGQTRVQKQINLFQRRPPSSHATAVQALEKIQKEAAKKAIEATEIFRPYYPWYLMLRKQINTMKMQLYYQLGDFKKVDELMPKCVMFDQQSLGMKMARMYRNNDEGLDKFFNKRCAATKGEARVFLASVYAWIKLKQNEPQKALEALNAAKKMSDNPTLADNIEHIANGRYRHFTNSSFGDTWYSLALEEPKTKPQRQPRGRMF